MKIKIRKEFFPKAENGNHFEVSLEVVDESEEEKEFCPFKRTARGVAEIEPICTPEFGTKSISLAANSIEEADMQLAELLNRLRDVYRNWVSFNQRVREWVGEREQEILYEGGKSVDAVA